MATRWGQVFKINLDTPDNDGKPVVKLGNGSLPKQFVLLWIAEFQGSKATM